MTRLIKLMIITIFVYIADVVFWGSIIAGINYTLTTIDGSSYGWNNYMAMLILYMVWDGIFNRLRGLFKQVEEEF